MFYKILIKLYNQNKITMKNLSYTSKKLGTSKQIGPLNNLKLTRNKLLNKYKNSFT